MNGQKHIIGREILDIVVQERGRALSVQNRISAIVGNKLNPALDELFSKLSGNNQQIRIDKLVIDIGSVSEQDLESEIVEKVVMEIEDKLKQLVKSSVKSLVDEKISGRGNKKNGNITIANKTTDILDQFVFFLKTGYLPWWSEFLAVKEPSRKAGFDKIFKDVLNVEKKLLRSALIPLLKEEDIRKRLVFQFSHSFLYELLKKTDEPLFTSCNVSFYQLLPFAGTGTNAKMLTKSFYHIVLENISNEISILTKTQQSGFLTDVLFHALHGKTIPEQESVLSSIFRALQQKKGNLMGLHVVITAFTDATIKVLGRSQLFQKIIQFVSKENEPLINHLIEKYTRNTKDSETAKSSSETEQPLKSYPEFDKPTKASVFSGTSSENKVNIEEKNFKRNREKITPSSTLLLETNNGQITIFNAGLVLLHPFLRYFFEGLNLLNDELGFKSNEEKYKAIHLLQFVATGSETTPEAELPLNKIMCGLEVTEPVPLTVPLSKEEKEECMFLIKTVLGRWEALKTNNPAALRETYLQREGILKQTGQSWNLTVERNTYDVMLEKLPWSFSFIKFPWCEQILYVEW